MIENMEGESELLQKLVDQEKEQKLQLEQQSAELKAVAKENKETQVKMKKEEKYWKNVLKMYHIRI
eukprot:UN26599